LATKDIKNIGVSSVLQCLYWLDSSFLGSSWTQWWIIQYYECELVYIAVLSVIQFPRT